MSPPRPPAGFWRRYAAWSLDAAALGALATVLAWPWWQAGRAELAGATAQLAARTAQALADGLVSGGAPQHLALMLLGDPGVAAAADAVQAGLGHLLGPWLLAYAALALPWHVLGEGSRWRGSPGKRLLGLAVADLHGDPLTPGRALARHAASALSWLSLNLGHALAALPPQRRALHDYLAGTRVLAPAGDPALPAWARAWLALQACGFVLSCAAGWWALSRALNAAVARALGAA